MPLNRINLDRTMVDYFNMENVIEYFRKSLDKQNLDDEDDISLDEYLLAYEEINKFFTLLGNVFSFVSSDVRSKIDILRKYQTGDDQERSRQFDTVKRMIIYERDNNLLNDRKYVSGCRTLLRLHRGLEFVYEFLNKLSMLSENDSTHHCCKDAYECTLARHHPWVVRKAANVAMYTLPVQQELLKRVCHDVPRSIEILPEMLNSARIVYERIDMLYTKNNLSNLP